MSCSTSVALTTVLNIACVALFIAGAADVWVTGTYTAPPPVRASQTVQAHLLFFDCNPQCGKPPFEGLVTHSNGEIPFANNDTWSFLRAACASLYLGFIFALFAALFGLGQLTGCLPALGTRVIVLYCTILAFVWGLIGTAIAGARISSDLVPSMQEPAYIASGFATITFVWSAAFGCAIAGTVISFVNISLAFYSGATAQAEHAPLQGTLSPAAPTDSAVKAEGAASDAGPAIKMRSLDAAV